MDTIRPNQGAPGTRGLTFTSKCDLIQSPCNGLAVYRLINAIKAQYQDRATILSTQWTAVNQGVDKLGRM